MTGTFHGKGWYKTWQYWYISLAVVKYEDLLVEEQVYTDIKTNRQILADPSYHELFFDDFLVHYDSLSDNYLYSLIENPPSKYNPTIHSVSDEFSAYEIIIHGDILDENSIQNNEKAQMLLYDDNHYLEYTLSAKTLPIVSLDMNNKKNEDFYLTSTKKILIVWYAFFLYESF